MATFEEITRHDDEPVGDEVWVAGPPVAETISVVEYDPDWRTSFDVIAGRIRAVMGDRLLELEHVGSTSVPGLAAKPVIDIDLTVVDSGDEFAYVPALARAGFELRIREPKWHQHRALTAVEPRANLHVWSPDSPEVFRHRMFRDWLREHPDDLVLYADAKRSAATASNAAGETVMAYNTRKEPVIREILDRMFSANGML